MYKDFYFEVRNSRGKLIATFEARWLAEKFAEEHKGFVVIKKNI